MGNSLELSVAEYISNGKELVVKSFSDGLKPPARIGVNEWSNLYRRLPSKGSAEPGKWRTARTPFLKEIMDCLDPYHPCRRVVFMKSSQVGGTEVLLNWVGSFIDTQRSAMMVVQPTLDMAEKWSKQRFAPMISAVPSLAEKIPPARSRDSGNTTLMKEWPGGLIAISGSNSAASLAMMPIANLGLDEIDRYPIELDGEGDPIKIAEARTTTFRRAKILLISSPTIESLSRITKEYHASDQRKYLVPCHHCQHMQELIWENLRYPEGETDKALVYCTSCGAGMDESQKEWMLANGKWHKNNPESKVAGFHISGLYAPLGLGKSWSELAEEFEEVKHDSTRLKVFKNTRLGLAEKDPNEKLEWAEIKARAEDYRLKEMPLGCLVVTVGVDVQKDRFAVLALGWGANGRQWVLDWVEIPADPTHQKEFNKITEYCLEGFSDQWGSKHRPLSVAIDSGNWQTEVLNYVRSKAVKGLFAVKGASTKFKPIISKPSKIDLKRNGKTLKRGAEQWIVGTDTAKFEIFSRLGSDKKAEYSSEQLIHFSKDLPEYFYVQLTAEIYDPNKRLWIKTQSRNEALDTYVYAIAAGYHPLARINQWKASKWSQLEKKQTQMDLLETQQQPSPKKEPLKTIEEPKPKPKKRPTQRRILKL